jgi:hypothetical protein
MKKKNDLESFVDKAVDKVFEGPYNEFKIKANKTTNYNDLLNQKTEKEEFSKIMDQYLNFQINTNVEDKKV